MVYGEKGGKRGRAIGGKGEGGEGGGGEGS